VIGDFRGFLDPQAFPFDFLLGYRSHQDEDIREVLAKFIDQALDEMM
jgi:hypothetical protein